MNREFVSRQYYFLTLQIMNYDDTYNGWTNWETWNASLWLNNEPYWQYRLQDCRSVDDVKEVYEEAVDIGYITDQITYFRINFQEMYDDIFES